MIRTVTKAEATDDRRPCTCNYRPFDCMVPGHLTGQVPIPAPRVGGESDTYVDVHADRPPLGQVVAEPVLDREGSEIQVGDVVFDFAGGAFDVIEMGVDPQESDQSAPYSWVTLADRHGRVYRTRYWSRYVRVAWRPKGTSA
ncbi:MAG: hypothetical protein OEW44_00125 [Gemmatimonadota bacterium]|nr:hypothetical protein [Gemmatimonadota bacterium]